MRMQIRFLSESEADYNKVLWRGKGSTCEIYIKISICCGSTLISKSGERIRSSTPNSYFHQVSTAQ